MSKTVKKKNSQTLKTKKIHLKHWWQKNTLTTPQRKIRATKDNVLTVENWSRMTKATHTAQLLMFILMRAMCLSWREIQPAQLTTKATSSLLSSLVWCLDLPTCQIIKDKQWWEKEAHQLEEHLKRIRLSRAYLSLFNQASTISRWLIESSKRQRYNIDLKTWIYYNLMSQTLSPFLITKMNKYKHNNSIKKK